MINVEKLKKEAKKREKLKKECYNKILTLINNKIIIVSKTNNTSTWFEIPLFMLGYPTYELKECSDYLIEKIKKNGFKISFLNPNILLINWAD